MLTATVFFLYDLKIFDGEKQKNVGVENGLILENLKKA